jgi:hypothetical protein
MPDGVELIAVRFKRGLRHLKVGSKTACGRAIPKTATESPWDNVPVGHACWNCWSSNAARRHARQQIRTKEAS